MPLVLHSQPTMGLEEGSVQARATTPIYPGVCLGVLTAGIHHVPDSVFLIAAEVLAGAVTKQELAEGR